MDAIIYWHPGWIWIGVIWGVIPMALLYYAARKPLKISYSLCPQHHRTLAVKRRIVLGIWALFAVIAVAAIAMEFNSHLMLVALVLFVVALIVHLAAGLSLRVRSYKGGVFGVSGFGEEFLAAVARPLERPRGEPSPT